MQWILGAGFAKLTWYPEAEGQDDVGVCRLQYLFLVVNLHGDVVGGVHKQVGHEYVEKVGGDAGPGDGTVQEEAEVDKLEGDDQDDLGHGEVISPHFPDRVIIFVFLSSLFIYHFLFNYFIL